jgi:DNA-binding MltR family transcriptional regulator
MAWHLNEDITIDAVKELIAQPARSAAIVGVAIIEKAITAGLLHHLPGSGRTVEELFDPRKGRLGDYDAKIKLAYAMGLIRKVAFNDLGKMANIRNMFAHRLDISEFDHPEVAKLCAELELIDTHVFEMGTSVETTPERSSVIYIENIRAKRKIPRERFYITAMFVTSTLVARTPHSSNPKPSPLRVLL